MKKVRWNRKKKDAAGNYNEDRVEWAQSALNAYGEAKGDGDNDESDIADLIADLMHLAASLGIEPSQLVQTAEIHFEAER